MKTNKQFNYISTFLLLFIPLFSNAQGPAIEWSKTYGGSRSELIHSIKPLPNGGYIAVGSTASNDGDIDPKKTTTQNDWWIIEFDNEGNMVRQAVYGTEGSNQANESLSDIIPLEEGGYIVLGTMSQEANGDFADVPHNGERDVLIAQLNDTLGIEWVKNYGGSGSETLNRLQKTSDDGYIACGTTTSEDGDINNKQNGNTNDWWIVKFDAQFNIQHERTFGGSGPTNFLERESAESVIELNNGNFAIAGMTSSNDGDLEGLGLGHNDATAMVINDTLGIEWVEVFGGSDDDRAYDIIQTSDGELVFSGHTASIDGTMEGMLIGGFDIWIAKLEASTGEMIWSGLYGGTEDDRLDALSGVNKILYETAEGELLFLGQTQSNDGDVSVLKGRLNAWFVKLNSEGHIEWERTYGGSETFSGGTFITDNLTNLLILDDGSFLLAGHSNSVDGDLNNTDINKQYEAWLLKLRPCPERVSLTETICSNETYEFHGTPLSEAGDHSVTLEASAGCDSIIILTLVVNPAPEPEITSDGNDLLAGEFASYEWLLDGDSIGANEQAFHAEDEGEYSVIVTNEEGCVATSEVYAHVASSLWSNEPTRSHYAYQSVFSDIHRLASLVCE